ncbi:hypothetical protein FRX31_011511, partial [Thalictrum thalictroides]
LRIQFEIEDETAKQDITVFEEQAKKLLGKSLNDLLDLSAQENGKTLVNEALDQIVGKRLRFYIRISEFNLTNPDSPPTAQKFSEATEKEAKNPKQN